MTEKNLSHLCMGCFTPFQTDSAFCTVCGYSRTSQTESPYQLPPRTMLSGKYLIGKVMGEGGFILTPDIQRIDLRGVYMVLD